MNLCLFCGEDSDAPDHALRCDGRQGRIEAAASLEPVAPYRPHENVRTSDPGTSHAAAHSLGEHAITVAQNHVRDCLDAAAHRGETDEELREDYVARYGPTAESTPRKRRHDLMRMGLVVDSGERRPLRSGRLGIVWKLTRYTHEAA